MKKDNLDYYIIEQRYDDITLVITIIILFVIPLLFI